MNERIWTISAMQIAFIFPILWSYDHLGRIISIQWKKKGKDSVMQALSYDLAGNITKMAREFGTYELFYDETDQLVKSDFKGMQGAPEYDREFVYDLVGNAIGGSRGPAEFYSNFLSQNGSSIFTSDLDGFGETIREVTGQQVKIYSYRADGRISDFSGGSYQVEYYYDGLGRRVAKAYTGASGTFTQSFLYLGLKDRILQAKLGDGSITTYNDGQGLNEQLGDVKSGVAKAYVTDHSGSVLNSAPAGSSHSYGVHGEVFAPPSISASSDPVMFGWQGLAFDAESGQWDNKARAYSPTIGRFLSQDPIGVAGGINLYSSRANNPLKFLDPTGFIHYNKKPPKTIPVTGATKDKLECVEACLALKIGNPDLDIRVGGGQEQSGHSKKSWHYKNLACDISNSGHKANKDLKSADVFSCAESCGFEAGQYETFQNPSNNHWHLQTKPGNRVPPINKGYEIEFDEKK